MWTDKECCFTLFFPRKPLRKELTLRGDCRWRLSNWQHKPLDTSHSLLWAQSSSVMKLGKRSFTFWIKSTLLFPQRVETKRVSSNFTYCIALRFLMVVDRFFQFRRKWRIAIQNRSPRCDGMPILHADRGAGGKYPLTLNQYKHFCKHIVREWSQHLSKYYR